jgi:hypothetical protein
VPAPVLVLGDQLLGEDLLDVSDAHLRALLAGTVGERVREPVHVAGGAVVDD